MTITEGEPVPTADTSESSVDAFRAKIEEQRRSDQIHQMALEVIGICTD